MVTLKQFCQYDPDSVFIRDRSVFASVWENVLARSAQEWWDELPVIMTPGSIQEALEAYSWEMDDEYDPFT